LALDVFHPDLARIASPASPEEIEDTAWVELAGGRRLRRTFRLTAKHLAQQTNDVELIYYVQDRAGITTRVVQAFPMRYFFRFEIEHLLARAGFEVRNLFGNFDRSQFSDSSPEMVLIAARKD
jgi:hypothetical protein